MGTLETLQQYRKRKNNPPAKIHEPRKISPSKLIIEYGGMALFVALVFSFLHFVLRG